MDVVVTYQSFVTTYTDFLTVAIHTILYERNIYPRTSFLSARKYNFSVRQNRHPKVCQWINDAVTAVEVELLKGAVERVAVVIYDRTDTPLERFVFDLSRFPYVPPTEQATPLERTNQAGEKVAVLPQIDLEEQLRATMSKLTDCGARLKPIPDECTFTVALELRDDREPPIAHPQAWIPVQPQLPKPRATFPHNSDAGNDPASLTTPLRSVAAGDMLFECWIEEGKAKLDRSSGPTSSDISF